MNDRLPVQGILSMHCSANVGEDGRSAIFFGLSGTGKTTLSTDSTRPLIGDDEHAWGDDGVFNIEGGCYAKTIGLSATAEPEIYGTTKMFGTILENVILDDVSRIVDLDDGSITENTRAAYSLEAIPNSLPDKRSGHPSTVIMLTADAFGVLPPVAKLTPEQASEQFLAGYTAKLAGTEIGVTEPQATFSACFGAAFLPQPPKVYAAMLAERIAEHGASAWLINTGWTGGSVRGRQPDADRGDARDRPGGALGRAGRGGDDHPPDLRARGADERPGRRLGTPRSAQHLGGPVRVRRQGDRARREPAGGRRQGGRLTGGR